MSVHGDWRLVTRMLMSSGKRTYKRTCVHKLYVASYDDSVPGNTFL